MYIWLNYNELVSIPMIRILIFIFVVGLFQSCSKDITFENDQKDKELKRLLSSASPTGNYDYYIVPEGTEELSDIPQDPLNELTKDKVELGKLLFYETAFATDAIRSSGMGTYSCASCHIPEAGFRPGAPQGVADGGTGFGINGENRIRNGEYKEDQLDVQSARPLALINVAYVTNTFWNGQFGGTGVNTGTEHLWEQDEALERNHLGYAAIETQNFEGIKTHRINVTKPLADRYGYTEMFDTAFPEVDEAERYSQFTASLAISAYIRTITSAQAPFQNYLRGDDQAMSEKEKKGALLFFGKARCTNCHYEKNLGSMEFHALGVKDMYQRASFNAFETDRRNLGRAGFTGEDDDLYKFRVPQLYNLVDAPFYFHGASKLSLSEVIDYKVAARSENPNVPDSRLSEKFNPVDLTKEEKEALISFISVSLRDPDLVRYKPDRLLSGFCFPNNDYQSKIDLGCN